MKKGEIRKQEIINTAERLFCQKGYEQTSIQDILDILNSSKGSFYHHFISKESLLEAVCAKRALQGAQTILSAVDDSFPASRNLNVLLSGMIPFRNEKMVFLLMLLPVFRLPEGRIIRLCYCDALTDLFLHAVADQLAKGHAAGELYCVEPEITADMILSLVNRLWVQICDMIISSEENNLETTDISSCLFLTERYRQCIEQIISLPFGSVELIDIPSLRMLCEQIHSHWTRSSHTA